MLAIVVVHISSTLAKSFGGMIYLEHRTHTILSDMPSLKKKRHQQSEHSLSISGAYLRSDEIVTEDNLDPYLEPVTESMDELDEKVKKSPSLAKRIVRHLLT